MADFEIRQDRLRKLSKSMIDSTESPKSLLRRVNGLEEQEIEFKNFYRDSDYTNEDDALEAFIKESLTKRVPRAKLGDKRIKRIPVTEFIRFALFFLDNLEGVRTGRDEKGNLTGLEPLTFDDLWDGLNTFARIKIKVKMLVRANNMPADLWRNTKRKDGHTKPIGKFVYSELLGFKSWSANVEKKLIEHKETFKSLAVGYFMGHSKYHLEIDFFRISDLNKRCSELDEKNSDMLVANALGSYLDFRYTSSMIPDCSVDLSTPDEPKFAGISLPEAVLARLQEDKKTSEDSKTFLEVIVKRPPIRKI